MNSNSQDQAGLNYFRSLPKWSGSGKFSLHNISELLKRFNNPQDKLKSVVVGGTNGKGSVSAMISSILGASGARVGLSISPHLSRMNERIVIDGEEILDADLNRLGKRISEISSSYSIQLSFHEAITAAAFIMFEELDLDWIVMEVGLGGRMDSVNVINKSEACAIVTIDFDHEKILGDSLAKIAREKAGIMREHGICVVGPISDEPLEVIKTEAERLNTSTFHLGVDYNIAPLDATLDTLEYVDSNGSLTVKPSLVGPYQQTNVAVATALARKLEVTTSAIQQGIAGTYWPGRLEYIQYKDNEIIIDCAHNPAGVRELIAYFNARGIKKVDVAFAALETKNWQCMLDLLLPYVNRLNILESDNKESVKSTEIQAFAHSRGVESDVFGKDYNKFLNRLNLRSGQMIITGSIYLIGILRDLLIPHPGRIWYRKS